MKFLLGSAFFLTLFVSACSSPATSSVEPTAAPSQVPSAGSCGIYASAMAKAGSLDIRVSTPSGKPAVVVKLVVSRNYTGMTCPSSAQLSTQANGEVLVTNLIPGNYSINLMNTSPAVYNSVDVTADATATVSLTMPSAT